MELTTIEGRAIAYRQVLRTSLRALIVDFARKKHAPETIPETVIAELLHQIHVLWAELCRYSQMVIGNYALLMEDEAYAGQCMREAMDTAAAVSSAAQAVAHGRRLRIVNQIARPEQAPREIEFSGGKVLL